MGISPEIYVRANFLAVFRILHIIYARKSVRELRQEMKYIFFVWVIDRIFFLFILYFLFFLCTYLMNFIFLVSVCGLAQSGSLLAIISPR